MNTKSIIEIFRGDDSDALGYQTIVGTIHTDLDLTGCKAVFRYLGFFQEFDPIPEDGKLTIVIPSASSMQFPPGFGYASLKVYDIDRKVRTFTNRIPVFVKTMTPCRGGGEFDVEFSPFPELEPLKIFKGPNADDFDQYTGFISKIIDRASAQKYGLSILFDAMDAEKTAEGGCAASPAAVKAAYDAIIGVLTDSYYTKAQTDDAIDKLAAYYITSDTQGNPFATRADLINATTYYSGGSVRTPTRNDYAIVIADETHNNEEWRYIYSENEQGVGQWEAQYAVEGVITFDDNVTRTSGNGVKSSGIWSAIWGALSALPSGVSSIYDWIVSQLSLKADKTYVDAKSSIKSPDGDTVVSANNDGTAKVTKTEHSLRDPVVTFANGYSIDYYGTTYTAPSGGETIVLVGPVPSASPWEPNATFYYPSTLGTLASFDPAQYSVWCIWVDGSNMRLMYQTGPDYIIESFDTENPTLTLNNGEVTGNPPIMTREDRPSSTEKTVATTDQIPAVPAPYTSNPNMDGSASAGSSDKFSRGDHVHPSDTSRVPTTRKVNSKALSSDVTLDGADILVGGSGGAASSDIASAINDLFRVKADLDSPTFTGTPVAPTPQDGENSVLIATTAFVQGAVPYALVTKTISNGAVSLDDRAINAVAVSSSLASLKVNFPTATSGKARDFGLRLTVASGITTAPELALPQGVTCENADGAAPEIGADGAATILYFTETASGVFLVKGEVITAIS